ncbi:potassium channel family protein [Lolliginicoccus levis]|uniref:potassium channel family protein n=1 Tax=Lolliginicoccus levis TaxID=2919542 RepID=UPI00241E8CDE|nr:potassium channel family protein [Lolliginicoccus levis]
MERKLGLLLAFVVLLQFGYPLTHYGEWWTAAYLLFYGGMIFFGVQVVRGRGRACTPTMVVGLLFAAFALWFALAQHSTVAYAGMLLSVGTFMLLLIVELMAFVFRRSNSGGLALILAAVCVYLILGGFFATVFSLIELAAPGSFSDPQNTEMRFQQFIYYSYVTMATLGYGEILPVAPWARALASLETVVGTMFLTIVVARLVGVWASQAPLAERDDASRD